MQRGNNKKENLQMCQPRIEPLLPLIWDSFSQKTLSLLVIVASTQQNLQLLHFLGSNILVENKTKVATEMKENRSEDIFVVCGIFSSQIKEEMISIVANCGEPMRTKNSPISHRLTTVVEVGKEQIV